MIKRFLITAWGVAGILLAGCENNLPFFWPNLAGAAMILMPAIFFFKFKKQKSRLVPRR